MLGIPSEIAASPRLCDLSVLAGVSMNGKHRKRGEYKGNKSLSYRCRGLVNAAEELAEEKGERTGGNGCPTHRGCSSVLIDRAGRAEYQPAIRTYSRVFYDRILREGRIHSAARKAFVKSA